MWAVCLAAGTCTRLGTLTAQRHKAMLPLGRFKLIDYQIRALLRAKIDGISIVVGHGGTDLSAHVRSNFANVNFKFVPNQNYRDRNMDWSALLGLRSVDDDVLYYEGDVLAAPEIIADVCGCDADLCVAVEPNIRVGNVDTKVIVEGPRVKGLHFAEHAISEPGDSCCVAGEMVCMLKLSRRARRRAVEKLERLDYAGSMQLYTIFGELFEEFTCNFRATKDRPWIEIDCEQDYLRAQQIAELLASRVGLSDGPLVASLECGAFVNKEAGVA
jgi:choline kinase